MKAANRFPWSNNLYFRARYKHYNLTAQKYIKKNVVLIIQEAAKVKQSLIIEKCCKSCHWNCWLLDSQTVTCHWIDYNFTVKCSCRCVKGFQHVWCPCCSITGDTFRVLNQGKGEQDNNGTVAQNVLKVSKSEEEATNQWHVEAPSNFLCNVNICTFKHQRQLLEVACQMILSVIKITLAVANL